MQKYTRFILFALFVLLSGVVQAHGLHGLENAVALAGSQHALVHIGEWALTIIAGGVILHVAFRIFKKEL